MTIETVGHGVVDDESGALVMVIVEAEGKTEMVVVAVEADN